MAIRSILVPLTGYEIENGALVAGLRLARRLGAFTDALHVKPDPREAVPFVTEGAPASVIVNLMELAEREAEARANQARRIFEGACAKANVIASGVNAGARYRTVVGRMEDEVPLRARVTDLVLMMRIAEEHEVQWRLALEAALMESGRPILLLPSVLDGWARKTVAIAWNGGVEAARAASAALPFLAQAERILLLAGIKDAPVEPSLDAVGEWLGHHGIDVEQRQLMLRDWPVEERLVDEAAEAGADLLVMGGYGHSRMRETIFGGATRAVLRESKLPVLMAH